jgi:hypothetical protein
MNLSVLVLIGLLALIAARKVGHIRVAIWQAMAAGALLVLAAAQIALLLLPLAFGSAMSPIGNPPNLLIAVRGPLEALFVDFLRCWRHPRASTWHSPSWCYGHCSTASSTVSPWCTARWARRTRHWCGWRDADAGCKIVPLAAYH